MARTYFIKYVYNFCVYMGTTMHAKKTNYMNSSDVFLCLSFWGADTITLVNIELRKTGHILTMHRKMEFSFIFCATFSYFQS